MHHTDSSDAAVSITRYADGYNRQCEGPCQWVGGLLSELLFPLSLAAPASRRQGL